MLIFFLEVECLQSNLSSTSPPPYLLMKYFRVVHLIFTVIVLARERITLNFLTINLEIHDLR